MSISYEEALSTLQAMFGEKWTQESLDTVLRHFKGHMENTVESLLNHGDRDPQLLLEKLKNGDDGIRSNVNTAIDEQLAQQLSRQGGAEAAAPNTPSTSPSTLFSTNNNNNNNSSSNNSGLPTNYTTRGTPTTLPDDFLRVAGAGASLSTIDSDEALARMLQDQLFSEELRRNPDFAHLAGARAAPRVSNMSAGQTVARNSFAAKNTGGGGGQPLPNIMEKLSLMGNSAKFRLAQLADEFKKNTHEIAAKVGGVGTVGGAGANDNSHSQREMKGLLDRDDNDAYELASRKDL